MKRISPKIYIFTLLLTVAVFSFALYISNYINQKKTEELKTGEDKISIDILSLESKLDVIKDMASCDALNTSTLRNEMNELGNRLTFMEQQLGTNNPDVFRLKRYYSLLEVRDYLLTQKAGQECKRNDILILYFYTPQKCTTCATQDYILQAIQQEHPDIRVYSFDFDLDLPAVETLITLHNIPKIPPIIDINGKEYAGFESLDDMNKVLQPLFATSTAATTTQKTKTPVKTNIPAKK